MNWGTKPYLKVGEIRKLPFNSEFKGKTSYGTAFNKGNGKELTPEFERQFDEKFYNDMKKRN